MPSRFSLAKTSSSILDWGFRSAPLSKGASGALVEPMFVRAAVRISAKTSDVFIMPIIISKISEFFARNELNKCGLLLRFALKMDRFIMFFGLLPASRWSAAIIFNAKVIRYLTP